AYYLVPGKHGFAHKVGIAAWKVHNCDKAHEYLSHFVQYAEADRQGDKIAEAQVMLDELLAAGEDMILQPYLAAVEGEGELSVIEFDGRFSHGVRKVPVAGDYRVQDDHGASDEPWIPDADARRLVSRTLEALAVVAPTLDPGLAQPGALPLLYARIDMLRGDDGALVLNELEIVEPSLFFRHGPAAGEMLAEALLRRL
ncbi:MAG: hypothetical protein KC457_36330, partial [Myxococcales bacterium]|nr:hypothetical protein [Myxococcales bacterium]